MERIEEIFCGMPKLVESFRSLDKRLKTCHLWAQDGAKAKEALFQERETLLCAAKGLDARDLKLLFYVKQLSRGQRHAIWRIVRKLYEAQAAYAALEKEGEE